MTELFDAGAGTPPTAPYRVLARKYRPASFADLIGQEAMVRTLSNAFETGRIHQAYILTGVRGVGKTTTARILARAFNYEAEGFAGPAIAMPTLGRHCQAIIESRHVDVIEMDAASNTGIDDVREIIDNARYRPVLARTKVYIVDEVHMLSKQAFNGLLKTLEEPPDHVRFLFATTEIDKVPVTVRSRCQRFDLRRVEPEEMVRHLGSICEKEGVEAEGEALSLVARAAEGSVRDALSLLDQAIAQAAGGRIEAAPLRAMLGVADRTRIVDLFESVLSGDVAEALGLLKSLYDQGADPAHVLSDVADFTHFVTRLKLAQGAGDDPSVTPEELRRGRDFAARLSVRVLSRAWQILLKGLDDVRGAPRPLAAADMVLVRLAHAADLPTLDEALRTLDSGAAPRNAPAGGARARVSGGADAPAPQATAAVLPAPTAGPRSLADLAFLARAQRDVSLLTALERDVRPVSVEPGRLVFSPAPEASPDLAAMLSRKLGDLTGMRWIVAVSSEAGAPTVREAASRGAEAARRGVEDEPVVRRVMELFPGATVAAIRPPAPGADAPPPRGAPEDDVAYPLEDWRDDEL